MAGFSRIEGTRGAKIQPNKTPGIPPIKSSFKLDVLIEPKLK
jgi:hypothetical protein